MLPKLGKVMGYLSLTTLAGDMLLVRGTLSIGRLTVLAAGIAKMSDPSFGELMAHVDSSGKDEKRMREKM